jgi:8-oxo-dGTP pyrophosphatase MutT (NUDIX family)
MRTQVREELKAIEPLDATEREHLTDALAWVDSGAQLFRVDKPATPPKHLVAYFAVVDADHILLVDHKNAQLWLPAGGHVEPGEHPRTTVQRELLEELGFTASHDIGAPLMITCTMTVGLTAGHTDVSLWYVVRANRTQNIKFDAGEFNAVRWFSFSDVPLHRSEPHLGRFIRKLTSQAATHDTSNVCSSDPRAEASRNCE